MRAPARPRDARAIAAGEGEARRSPRREGRDDLLPGRALEEGAIGGRSDLLLERGRVPGAAHHGDGALRLLRRLGDFAPHMRLAQRLLSFGRRSGLAKRAHGLGDRGEDGRGLGIFLDDVAPPAFAVFIAAGGRQNADRIALDRRGRWLGGRRGVLLRRLSGFDGLRRHETPARRDVDEARPGTVAHRPARGLVFGRIARKGPEDGAPRIVRRVGEERDRRHHRVVGEKRQQLGGVGRSLDEHQRGTQAVERLEEPPRRARPVMANAEDADLGRHCVRRDRSAGDSIRRSPSASSARSRDIPRAPPCPAPGP